MQYFFIWLILSVCCAVLAGNRGRNEISWFFISALISPLIGFILLIILDDMSEDVAIKSGSKKTCLYCAEIINSEAIKCKHCGSLQSKIKPENLNEKELNDLINKIQNNKTK